MDPAPPTQAGFTRAQSREIDRIAIEELGLPGIVLMENAGRSVAQAILEQELAHVESGNDTCVVFCGGGNNGGDGFVIARWLAEAGVHVECVCTAKAEDTRGDARIARDVAVRSGIMLHDASMGPLLQRLRARFVADPPRLVVDALLGTGFVGTGFVGRGLVRGGFLGTGALSTELIGQEHPTALRAEMALAIEALNAIGADHHVRTWSVDLPSGLDCDLGTCADPTVRADVTATFVASKVGFARAEAASVLGRVLVLPIGIPRALIERVRARQS